MPFKLYGRFWPDNVDPFIVELGLYASERVRNETDKCHSKWEHLRNAIKMHLPDQVFRWHRWVDDFGEEWCNGTQINVWGAGGTTKSGIVGMLCLFDLLAKPKDTLIVMVTNPQEKHWDRCFSKTLQWRRALPAHLQIGKLVKSPKPALATLEAEDGSRRGILCISIADGETGQEIGKKVGAHAPRTRLILEEGQTLPRDTLDIATNLFMGSADKKEVIIGNPMSWRNNAMGEASTPLGMTTREVDDKQPDRWLNQRTHGDDPGVTLVFDGLKCPTFDSPEEAKRLHFMIQPKDVESIRRTPGVENTLNFWSQVRGRVPPAGQVVTVLSEMDYDHLQQDPPTTFIGQTSDYLSLDLSLGGDKIPVYHWKVGLTVEYGKVARKTSRDYIIIDVTKPDRSGQIAKKFVELFKAKGAAQAWMNVWGERPLDRVSMDCSGQQGAIADRCEAECHLATIKGYVYRVRSEEAVSERQLSHGRVLRSDPIEGNILERACDRYKDRATELVMNITEMMGQRCIWGLNDDGEVKDQLCSRGYDENAVDGGKCKVQKKKEWRETHGNISPDEMDSVGVFCAHALEKRIIVPGKDTKPRPQTTSTLPKFMQAKAATKAFMPKSSKIAAAMGRR